MPEIGDKAPDFTMPTDGEGDISLASLKGKNVVLYFYPKDNTPGCTTEAIDFSAKIKEFDKAGTVVVGVSRDSVKKHANFREKHDLHVILGADEDGSVCEAYGVWVEKMNYGRKYMGIERSTFLIDGKGVIRNVWRKVKVKGHADAVLEAVQALS
ncbi:MAG: thioredoxin-dependent thiol peroxidase [Sneathiella sp.]|jgi:peroxiredoxin Q/BCP|uniref:thioredoxin-dependent thiol peroxidase n=1 Tax=Sneathiella sp. TaxID=1964365 RepID=UPI000C49D8AE|nr:thioredoxin-dependent thiol peroxidase [Sneathiella sp.]MAL79920.1 thioredoxin-dependent thiol peroxidase [Sneathiella sp.]|tara:strand:+ start:321 stop:785 length:465 start_codon:yes stop_codon:yes gene_type:complete